MLYSPTLHNKVIIMYLSPQILWHYQHEERSCCKVSAESVCFSIRVWWKYRRKLHWTINICVQLYIFPPLWKLCLLSLRSMWFPAGSVFTCEGLWDSNRQVCPSSITDNLSVSSCSLDHKALREKELHPPRSAETPNREETSRADRLDRWREWSEGIPPVSALHLTAQVRVLWRIDQPCLFIVHCKKWMWF